jgi:hypothetical protein
MKPMKYMLLGLLVAVMAACSAKNTKDADSKPSGFVRVNQYFDDNITKILNFHEEYSNLAIDAQKKAFSESSQALSINKNHLLHRVRMATMLTIPTSHLRDLNKAQPLLQELMRDNSLGKEELAYVGLLYEFCLDSAKQQQKLKESNKQLDTQEQKLQTLQKKYDALEQKNSALEQKLIDLKNIEKSLNGR